MILQSRGTCPTGQGLNHPALLFKHFPSRRQIWVGGGVCLPAPLFASRLLWIRKTPSKPSWFFHGRAKRASLSVKSSYVEQGGVFRLARVVLSVTTDAPRPLGRMCRRTESAPAGGVQRARAYKNILIY